MEQTSDTPVVTHNKFVVGLIIFLVIGLASGAFILSFDALHALALASAIASEIAWLWPIIIDGFIVTATIAIFALRGRGKGTTRYIWAMLILFAFVSVFGNSIHAVNNQDILGVDLWIASAVSAAPAVALLLASHFLVIMISSPKNVTVSQVTVHDGDKETTAVVDDLFQEPRVTVPRPLPERVPVTQKTAPEPIALQPAVPARPLQTVENRQADPDIQTDAMGVKPFATAPSNVNDMVAKMKDNEQLLNVTPNEEKPTSKEYVPETVKIVETAQEVKTEPVANNSATLVQTSSKPTVLSDEQLIHWLKNNDRKSSYPVIADALGVSARTIQRRVRKLKDVYGEDLATL